VAVALTTAAALLPVTDPAPAEAALRKQVVTDYVMLRSAPGSYAVGTAYRGWTVDVQQEAVNSFRWGHVYGTLNTCLWLSQAGLPEGGASTADACRHTGRTLSTSEFTNGMIGGTETDGASITVTGGSGCTLYDGVHVRGYGNVRPWQTTAQPSEPIDTLVAVGETVRWRYVSRDGRWVMVRAPQHGSTDGTGLQAWFFVPRGCLPL